MPENDFFDVAYDDSFFLDEGNENSENVENSDLYSNIVDIDDIIYSENYSDATHGF